MSLKIDYCDPQAAAYAVKHWHYSKSLPGSKKVKLGVWEDEKFVGCVIFSHGANKYIGRPYDLEQTEICELTRVALDTHKTPVTKIIAICLKILKRDNAGLKLVISYADSDQGHEGKIYQAGNWIYEGLMNKGEMGAFILHGKKTHPKTIHSKYGKGSQQLKWLQEHVDPKATIFYTKGKHKYLMPLTEEMRAKMELRRKPFHTG